MAAQVESLRLTTAGRGRRLRRALDVAADLSVERLGRASGMLREFVSR